MDIKRVVACDQAFAPSICTPDEIRAAPLYDPRRLLSPRWWPEGAAGPWRARCLDVGDGYCAWACWCTTGVQAPAGGRHPVGRPAP